jgi:hypothetical protein
MPDEGALNPVLGQQCWLKGVQTQDVPHALADLVHPLRTPSPNGRAHQLDRRNAALLECALHRQVEVRGIYPHKQVGRVLQQIVHQLLANTSDAAVAHQRLNQATHRELVARPAGLETQGLHLRPANATGLQIGPGLAHAAEQQSSKLVTRTLGHDHGNTHAAQAPAPLRPPGSGG